MTQNQKAWLNGSYEYCKDIGEYIALEPGIIETNAIRRPENFHGGQISITEMSSQIFRKPTTFANQCTSVRVLHYNDCMQSDNFSAI